MAKAMNVGDMRINPNHFGATPSKKAADATAVRAHLIESDDAEWSGLYLNGRLAIEGPGVLASETLEFLSGRTVIQAQTSKCDGAWLLQVGSLPESLSDVRRSGAAAPVTRLPRAGYEPSEGSLPTLPGVPTLPRTFCPDVGDREMEKRLWAVLRMTQMQTEAARGLFDDEGPEFLVFDTLSTAIDRNITECLDILNDRKIVIPFYIEEIENNFGEILSIISVAEDGKEEAE